MHLFTTQTQDNIAELSEVFLIRLNSVTLDSTENGEVPPIIGTNQEAQVTILPNDNPEGILAFLQSRYCRITNTKILDCFMLLLFSCSVNVTEDAGDVVLTVRRDQGRVGHVSAVVLITGQGATANQDFIGINLEARKYYSVLPNNMICGTTQLSQTFVLVTEMPTNAGDRVCVGRL